MVHNNSIVIMYSSYDDLHSHICRYISIEKKIGIDVLYTDDQVTSILPGNVKSAIETYKHPVLIDDGNIIYDARLVNEYLDERFPYPPLLHGGPVIRAKLKTLILHMERRIFKYIENVIDMKQATEESITTIKSTLEEFEKILTYQKLHNRKYIMGDVISLVDCYLMPALIRINYIWNDLKKEMPNIYSYMERLYKTDTFLDSMSMIEHSKYLVK